MKLTVERQELLDRLSNIQNVVEKRNTMPVLSHFLLEAGKDGSRISATDIETAIREPITVEVESEGMLCIPARKLFEIVKEIKGDVQITIASEDSQWIRVSAGKSSGTSWPASNQSETSPFSGRPGSSMIRIWPATPYKESAIC